MKRKFPSLFFLQSNVLFKKMYIFLITYYVGSQTKLSSSVNCNFRKNIVSSLFFLQSNIMSKKNLYILYYAFLKKLSSSINSIFIMDIYPTLFFLESNVFSKTSFGDTGIVTCLLLSAMRSPSACHNRYA